MSKFLAGAALIAALCACQQRDDTADKATVSDLRVRVETLEQHQAELANELQRVKAEKVQPAVAVADRSAAPAMTYRLERAGAPPEEYPTKARCEAARAAVLDGFEQAKEAAQAQGAVFVSPVAVMCVPQ